MGLRHLELASGTPYLEAKPSAREPSGYGLVLGPDLIGLRQCFEEMVVELAEGEGWIVAAPEPFPDHVGADVWTKMRAMGTEVDIKRQREDIIRAADATGCERVGLLGFCMGGFLGYVTASSGRFESLVAMYGPLLLHDLWKPGQHQVEPLEALEQPHAPLLAIIAALDTGTPPAAVQRLRQLPDITVVEYPEADHAFVHEKSREVHRPDDAADAMARSLRFLHSGGTATS